VDGRRWEQLRLEGQLGSQVEFQCRMSRARGWQRS
jgi:hypothetical protein